MAETVVDGVRLVTTNLRVTTMATAAAFNDRNKRLEPTPTTSRGLPLGNIFSIQVRLHVSVVIIGSLIVASLARGILPEWHPQWSTWTIWSAAIVAGLLFFVSLLAHEFAHALTARRFGITTNHITLFLFGAMAAIEHEPETPKQEFLIAAAGPAMSLALALLFSTTVAVSDPTFCSSNVTTDSLELSFSNLSYLGTIAFWLASVNAMLGLFNLFPGFPMDGGRILRAVLWWKSSDLAAATRAAARGGVIFGWLLVIYGAILVLNNHLFSGLWTAAIGYFISQLARNSAEQFLHSRILQRTTVADIMRTRFDRIEETVTLDSFVDDYLLRSTQRLWPVTRKGKDVGYISLEDIPVAVDRVTHGLHQVANCMHPLTASDSLNPQTSGVKALHRLAEERLPLPVLDDCGTLTVVGLIHQTDVLRWIAQHPNLADTPD